MKISCLGPDGSYSCLAARALCPDDEIILCKGFPAVTAMLKEGEVDGAVLPIENSLQGAVLQNLDIIESMPEFFAVKEYVQRIDHRLATVEGAERDKIRYIYSHQQALAQCGKYLTENFPTAQLIATSSTAESLNKITSEEAAGIVGSHVKRKGIVLSKENIADEKENFTHFLLFVKGKDRLAEHTSKAFISVSLKDEPGTLLKLLQVIYVYGLNMTKIESRPIKRRPGEYRFFIEFEGDRADWKVLKAIDDMKEYCLSFRVLGMY